MTKKKSTISKVKKGRARPAGAVREFILSKVAKHPGEIVALTARHFAITSVAVQKHLRQLVDEGRIAKKGNTRSTRWVIAPKDSWEFTIPIGDSLREHEVWEQTIKPLLRSDIRENVQDVIRYGFTEILNNVIDHSNAGGAKIEISSHGEIFTLTITDDGVGIFKKIQEAFGLADARESILELTKGKVTTDRSRHSGEGLFFTSRAFDRFELESRGLVFIKDNLNDDWLVDSRAESLVSGTAVTMRIRKSADTELRAIFDRYVDGDTYRFDRTHIVVELAKLREADYISRSQAKRILAGLEKFRHVVLDFRNVRTVGQGFVDEVFRVFAQSHPDVKFEVVNAQENVDFMIRRGIATGAD